MLANIVEQKLSELENLQPELYKKIKDSLFKKDLSNEDIKKLFESKINFLRDTEKEISMWIEKAKTSTQEASQFVEEVKQTTKNVLVLALFTGIGLATLGEIVVTLYQKREEIEQGLMLLSGLLHFIPFFHFINFN